MHGLTGPGDTLPSSHPVPRELEVHVRVTAPLARVRAFPAAHEARVGEPVTVRGEVRDVDGRVVAGAPFLVEYDAGGHMGRAAGPGPVRLSFHQQGRRAVVASFGGLADTLMIEVLPAQENGGGGDPPPSAAPEAGSAAPARRRPAG